MNRRAIIKLLGGVAAWPIAARGQQPALPVIGFLSNIPPESYSGLMPAFREGLKETGFIEGQNVTFAFHWTNGGDDLPRLAAEMVARKPNVIVCLSGTAGALALKNATKVLPVIFFIGADPVKFGLVGSLSRPGGNLTGLITLSNALPAKQIEVLHELVPNAATRLLVNPANPNAEFDSKEVRAAAGKLDRKLIIVQARTEDEINVAFSGLAAERVSALMLAADLFFLGRRTQIITLSARYGLPTVHDRAEFARAGGLASYGSNRPDLFRHAGIYAARILRGEKPGDLPVQQATKFELIINLQTAKALGLTVPPTLLSTADEVIE
jgi:putative ABC transport system substrate-binding protein